MDITIGIRDNGDGGDEGAAVSGSFVIADSWEELSPSQWKEAIALKGVMALCMGEDGVLPGKKDVKVMRRSVLALAKGCAESEESPADSVDYDGASPRRGGVAEATGGVADIVGKLNGIELLAIAEGIEWLGDMPVHNKSYMKWWCGLRGMNDNMSNCTLKQLGLIQMWMEAMKPEGAAVEQEIVVDENGMERYVTPLGSGDDEEDVAVKAAREAKALRGLMAVTFRLPFLRWSDWMCDVYMVLFKLVPKRVMVMNMYNLWGMMQMLRVHYPWVYDTTGQSDDGGPQHGFRSLIESLAGGKFGDFYKVQRAKMHDVMVHLDHNAYRVEKMNKGNKGMGEIE